MIDRDTVLDTLNEIVDPCSRAAGVPAGLVDMGLITRCETESVTGRVDVRVAIAITEPGCLMHAVFVNEARERLAGLRGVGTIDVVFDYETHWVPSRMHATYRRALARRREATLRRYDLQLPT